MNRSISSKNCPRAFPDRSCLRPVEVLAAGIDVLVVHVHQPVGRFEHGEQDVEVAVLVEEGLERDLFARQVAREPLDDLGRLPVLVVIDLDVDLVAARRAPRSCRRDADRVGEVVGSCSPALGSEHPGDAERIHNRSRIRHRNVEHADMRSLRVGHVPDRRGFHAVQTNEPALALNVAEREPEDPVLPGFMPVKIDVHPGGV